MPGTDHGPAPQTAAVSDSPLLAATVVTPGWAVPHLPEPVGQVAASPGPTLAGLAVDLLPGAAETLAKRRRSVLRFAALLAEHQGRTWQQRWLASGWEQPGRLLRDLNAGLTSYSITAGFKWFAAMRVIVPSLPALQRNAVPDYAEMFRLVQRDPLLDEVMRRLAATTAKRRYQQGAMTELAFALTSQAIPMADLTPEALLHFGFQYRDLAGRAATWRGLGGVLIWDVLVTMGQFPPGTPTTLRSAVIGGRRSVTDLVDQYRVAHPEIRQLLIDYISHRQVQGMDYNTVCSITRDLVRNFWVVVQDLNPGQADLHLTDDLYRRWRDRVAVRDTPDGSRPRKGIHDLLIRVRTFYLDLHSWAAEDPARWGRWITACPVPPASGRAYSRDRQRLTERMADRTRLRQPLLPMLVEHVTRQWQHYRQLLAATEQTPPGGSFRSDGTLYTRVSITTGRQASRSYLGPGRNPLAVRDDSGVVLNVDTAVDHAFWSWAVTEVLRLTGIRHEELLELSHLSMRRFQRPNGEVIALLVVAPSKTDQERVIPVSAELLHVLAEIIRYQTRDGKPIPLIRRWDPYERQHSDLLPFLFQHQLGPHRLVFSSTWVLKKLQDNCAEIAREHPQFAGIKFTPHDFRRIFATDLVNNGLPIHIGAALLGHANLQTTRGYVAVFDEDVVRHYQQFLERRRQLRPTEEYRPTTEQEWADFENHFDKRKVELGNCARPYGTPCNHEHACIRCCRSVPPCCRDWTNSKTISRTATTARHVKAG
jgi:site-specific recombinase XerC